jgi:hypothetical protein
MLRGKSLELSCLCCTVCSNFGFLSAFGFVEGGAFVAMTGSGSSACPVHTAASEISGSISPADEHVSVAINARA